ncbi:MAG: exosortase-associated EpsI family protein [Armatimonadota bacterium]
MRRFQIYACIVTVVLVCSAALVSTASRAGTMRIKEDYKDIPMKAAQWNGENGDPDVASMKILTTASILTRRYNNDMGDVVDLSIVYAQNIGDLHQPEKCMEGTGFRRSTRIPVWITPNNGKKHEATLVVFTDSTGSEIIMIYWFYIDGKAVPNMGNKSSAFWHFLWSGAKPCAMIKYTTTSITGVDDAKRVSLSLASYIDSSVLDVVKGTPELEPSNLAVEK